MALYNFGYAGNLLRSISEMYASRDISPPSPGGVNTLSHNMGDIARSQYVQLSLLTTNDFLWGCHLWGSKKYKVTK